MVLLKSRVELVVFERNLDFDRNDVEARGFEQDKRRQPQRLIRAAAQNREKAEILEIKRRQQDGKTNQV